MPRAPRQHLFVAAALAVTGLACSDAATAPAPADQHTEGLRLSVAVAPAAVGPNDTVAIRMTLRNSGSAEARFNAACEPWATYGVWRPDAHGTTEACTGTSRIVTLAPGATLERTVVRPVRAVAGDPVVAGAYVVQVTTNVLGVRIPAEASFTVR